MLTLGPDAAHGAFYTHLPNPLEALVLLERQEILLAGKLTMKDRVWRIQKSQTYRNPSVWSYPKQRGTCPKSGERLMSRVYSTSSVTS